MWVCIVLWPLKSGASSGDGQERFDVHSGWRRKLRECGTLTDPCGVPLKPSKRRCYLGPDVRQYLLDHVKYDEQTRHVTSEEVQRAIQMGRKNGEVFTKQIYATP